MNNLSERFRAALDQRGVDNPTGLGIQFKHRLLTNIEVLSALNHLRMVLGDVRGLRMLLLLPDSLEAYLLYLHFMLEGAVLIPVSVQEVGERIQDIFTRVSPDLVITNQFLYQAHNPILKFRRCMVVCNPTAHGSWRFEYECVGFKAQADRMLVCPPRPAEVVRLIIFTSGSTGVPKGVCLSEANVLSAADMMVQFLPLEPTTRSLVTVPLYDYYGMIQVFGHVLGGSSYLFGLSTALPVQLLGAIRGLHCTDLVLVPHTLRLLLKSAGTTGGEGLKAIQRITTSSDILTSDLLCILFEVNPDVTVVNIYGLTEAGRACYRKITRDTPFSNSVGRPSPGVEVEIQEDAGLPGEVIIRGPNVSLGYLTDVGEDAVAFNPCTEMRTGDLGYFDENGEIILLGRRDHMINMMGMKIHPSEIESAALQVPGIADARSKVAMNREHEKVIHLDVVCTDTSMTTAGIIESLHVHLPRVFVPTIVSFVENIERTDIGAKVIR